MNTTDAALILAFAFLAVTLPVLIALPFKGRSVSLTVWLMKWVKVAIRIDSTPGRDSAGAEIPPE
jgi:hypothetical protein